MEAHNVIPLTGLGSRYAVVIEIMEDSGRQFSETGKLFMDFESPCDLEERISLAKDKPNDIADVETAAYQQLIQAILPE
jgi:hypothetical protein